MLIKTYITTEVYYGQKKEKNSCEKKEKGC